MRAALETVLAISNGSLCASADTANEDDETVMSRCDICNIVTEL